MPKRIKAAAKRAKNISRGQQILRQLKRPVILIPSLIVLGVLIYFGAQQHRASVERRAFQKIEQQTTRAISDITNTAGQPFRVDSSHACYMRAPEEFSKKELFCKSDITAYYKIASENKDSLTLSAKKALENQLHFNLHKSSIAKEEGATDYEMGAQDISFLNNATCSASILYPATFEDESNLIIKDHGNNIMSISLGCYVQTVKPIYPMTSY